MSCVPAYSAVKAHFVGVVVNDVAGLVNAVGLRVKHNKCYIDKKENQIFLIYKEIQIGAVAKSYLTNGLLIYGKIFAHFLIYYEVLPHI